MRNVPENLINFRVYEDGGAFLGISDVTLPKLSAMTQTIKGAGLAGELEAPTRGHYSSCEAELNWRTIEKDLLHLAANKALSLDLRGAGQGYDSESGEYTTRKIKILLRGRPKEADLGKLEVGATTDSKTTIECDYIKIDIDGENKLELDKYNFICKVDGVDYLEDVRDALGM